MSDVTIRYTHSFYALLVVMAPGAVCLGGMKGLPDRATLLGGVAVMVLCLL